MYYHYGLSSPNPNGHQNHNKDGLLGAGPCRIPARPTMQTHTNQHSGTVKV